MTDSPRHSEETSKPEGIKRSSGKNRNLSREQEEARARFIEENMGLVHACARRLQGRGIEYEDLAGAGSIGLVKAADGFDSTRGLAFSTYAVPVILGEIRRLFRDGGAVKIGRTTKDRARALLKLKDSLTETLGREPGVRELGEAAGLDCAETAILLGAVSPPLSLTPSEEPGQFDLPVDSQEEALSNRIALQQVLANIGEQERALIECRYLRRLTQVQTAQKLGMTQVQVSRKERAILLNLRQQLE